MRRNYCGNPIFHGFKSLKGNVRLLISEQKTKRRGAVDYKSHRSDTPASVDEILGRFALGQRELGPERPYSGENRAINAGLVIGDEACHVASVAGDNDHSTTLNLIEQLGQFGFGLVGTDCF
ncbi:hypothetical protein AW736_24095 [Termitidicoccus mucosus]|uniref:Uncharacterized protein n=1 Tax=Termitidicoccus mucosus TaxID=1184151 RepID=A0A178IE35_9BACT|nr:hypothetical protein AW736_24095 [Opitutaceae bacterium TSB47]